MRRTWSANDIWDENDPALRRLREAIAPRQPVPDAPGQAEPVEAVSEPTEPIAEPPSIPRRRDHIGELVARVRNGDLSAVDMLRKLLDGR